MEGNKKKKQNKSSSKSKTGNQKKKDNSKKGTNPSKPMNNQKKGGNKTTSKSKPNKSKADKYKGKALIDPNKNKNLLVGLDKPKAKKNKAKAKAKPVKPSNNAEIEIVGDLMDSPPPPNTRTDSNNAPKAKGKKKNDKKMGKKIQAGKDSDSKQQKAADSDAGNALKGLVEPSGVLSLKSIAKKKQEQNKLNGKKEVDDDVIAKGQLFSKKAIDNALKYEFNGNESLRQRHRCVFMKYQATDSIFFLECLTAYKKLNGEERNKLGKFMKDRFIKSERVNISGPVRKALLDVGDKNWSKKSFDSAAKELKRLILIGSPAKSEFLKIVNFTEEQFREWKIQNRPNRKYEAHNWDKDNYFDDMVKFKDNRFYEVSI